MLIRLLVLPVAAVLALAAAACGGSSSSRPSTGSPAGSTGAAATETEAAESQSGTTTIGDAEANDHGTKDVSGLDEISLELDDFYFEPTVLEGTPGQKLRIELENESGTEHNLSIDEQSVDQDVEAGGTETVTVTFPASGELQLYCKYHKQLGMVGGLRIG